MRPVGLSGVLPSAYPHCDLADITVLSQASTSEPLRGSDIMRHQGLGGAGGVRHITQDADTGLDHVQEGERPEGARPCKRQKGCKTGALGESPCVVWGERADKGIHALPGP